MCDVAKKKKNQQSSMNERQRDQKIAMGREREKEWGKTYKYTPHRRRLVYFFFGRCCSAPSSTDARLPRYIADM